MSARHATRLALLMAIAMAMPAVSALQPGTFTQYPLQPSAGAAGIQMTRLAVVDASASSRQWLRSNADYLRAQQIPVMVVHSAAPEVQTLLAEYQGSGLLLGAAPEPPELLDAMLQRMGVEFYPAVIEDGVVWQVRDESVQRPARTAPEAITIPSHEEPQPVLTEGPDTAPSAEAVALQQQLDAMRQGTGTDKAAVSAPGTVAGAVQPAVSGNRPSPATGTGAAMQPASENGQ